jgi:hypothetical protein
VNIIKGFSFRRFFLLIRNDLFLNRSHFLIFSGVVTGILLLNYTLAIINQVNPQSFQTNLFFSFFFILFWGGIITTNKVFKDLRDEVRGSSWLTLPTSMLEKFVSRLILLTVIYPLMFIVLIFLLSLISVGLDVAFIGSIHGIFNPFDKSVLLGIATYIVLQSPFLLGVIYFKRRPVPKTFLTIAGYLILLILIARGFYMVIYPQSPEDSFFNIKAMIPWIIRISTPGSGTPFAAITWVQRIFFWGIVAPVCWVIGYIRLKEKEI